MWCVDVYQTMLHGDGRTCCVCSGHMYVARDKDNGRLIDWWAMNGRPVHNIEDRSKYVETQCDSESAHPDGDVQDASETQCRTGEQVRQCVLPHACALCNDGVGACVRLRVWHASGVHIQWVYNVL